MQLVLMGERRRGGGGGGMMFRTLCSVSLTALFAIYGLHLSHDLFPFIFSPHFLPLPLVFASSASLRINRIPQSYLPKQPALYLLNTCV